MILFHRAIGKSDLFEDGTKSITDLLEGGGGNSDSGLNIGVSGALTYHPVWKAVNLLGSSVARTPCHCYKRVKGGKERAPTEPGEFIIRRQPAPGIPPAPYYMAMMAHVALRGNHYSYIKRDGTGRPLEVWPLDPRRVTPILEDGQPFYVYQTPESGYRKLFYDDVIHIRGLGFDGLQGYSVIDYMRNSIGLGMAAEKYTNKFFANSAEARVLLTTPNTLTAEQIQALKLSWDSMHRGLDNVGRTAVLEGGLDVKTLSVSARDSQLLETMQQNVRAVANWFMMPPHKLGDNSRTAYNSIESENQSFLDEAVDYWLVTIEQEYNAKLLTDKQFKGDTHYFEFTRQALVRANLEARANYYQKALGNAPWMTRDEVRGAENLNPTDGGDKIILPTNNFGTPPESEPAPEPPQRSDPHPELIKATKLAFEDVRVRMQTRAQKAYVAGCKTKTPAESREDVSVAHYTIMHEALYPQARALGLAIGQDPEKLAKTAIDEILAKLGA